MKRRLATSQPFCPRRPRYQVVRPRPSFDRALRLATLLSLSLCPAASAQTPAGVGGHEDVRHTAERILSRPEFRHFPRLQPEQGQGPRGAGSSPSWTRSGGSGSGSGGNGGSGGGTNGGDRADEADGGGDSDGARGPFDRELPGSSVLAPLGGILAPGLHGVAWVIVAIIVGGILAAIGIAVVRWFADRDRDASEDAESPSPLAGEEEHEAAPGETPADVFVARARELAQVRRYREAVAQLVLGGMSQIERAGWIEFRRGLTVRDYLRAVRRQPSVYRSMKSMVRVYEPIGFGRREATERHFDLTMADYEAGFRATTPADQD